MVQFSSFQPLNRVWLFATPWIAAHQASLSITNSPSPPKKSEVKVKSLGCVWLFATPWTTACQASLFITNSQSSRRLTSIESVMPSSHPILCCPLLLLPSIFPSIRVFAGILRLVKITETKSMMVVSRAWVKWGKGKIIFWWGQSFSSVTFKLIKFLKRQEYQTTLRGSWETCMQVKKQ